MKRFAVFLSVMAVAVAAPLSSPLTATASAGLRPPVVVETASFDEQLSATRSTAAGLPAPFSGWDVKIEPRSGEDGALTVSYDSPALGERIENSVYLPTRYAATGQPFPVLYFLHGTVFPHTDNPAFDTVTGAEFFVDMTGSGGGDTQTKLQDFPSERGRAQFLVVSPDTNPENSWCETCLWIDGKKDDSSPNLHPITAKTVPAETVIYTELIPLVEHLFNVRTDRGGRGISGFSMGGVGAFLHGFRHPDMYSYVASISGAYDLLNDSLLRSWVDTAGYFRDQGFGTSATDTVAWKNFSPREIAVNYAGSGGQLMISAGDVCSPPTDAKGAEDCAAYPPVRHPFASWAEAMLRSNLDRSLTELTAMGVSAKQVRFSGVHGANNHRVYAEVIVPQANHVFSNPVVPASRFTFRTADPQFAVWGFTVSVDRDDAAEFLSIENAEHDGSAFSLRGSGRVAVTTPRRFSPGRAYRISYSSAVGRVQDAVVDADIAGRLHIAADLGDPRFSNPSNVGGVISPPDVREASFVQLTVSPA